MRTHLIAKDFFYRCIEVFFQIFISFWVMEKFFFFLFLGIFWLNQNFHYFLLLNTKLSLNSGLVLVITIQMSPLWALYVKNWRRNSQKSPKKSILQDGCFLARPKIDYYLDPRGPTKVVLRTVRYRHTVHKVRYHANSCLMWRMLVLDR